MKRQTGKNTRAALPGDYRNIIGESPQVVDVPSKIERVAKSEVSVLICGETGTGKE